MRFLICLWLLVMTFLCMMPMWLKDAVGTTGQLHYIGHFFAFAITALLFCWKARDMQNRLARTAAAVAVGILLEVLERISYHNHLEKRDILVNTLGVIAGSLAAFYLSQRNLGTAALIESPSQEN